MFGKKEKRYRRRDDPDEELLETELGFIQKEAMDELSLIGDAVAQLEKCRKNEEGEIKDGSFMGRGASDNFLECMMQQSQIIQTRVNSLYELKQRKRGLRLGHADDLPKKSQGKPIGGGSEPDDFSSEVEESSDEKGSE